MTSQVFHLYELNPSNYLLFIYASSHQGDLEQPFHLRNFRENVKIPLCDLQTGEAVEERHRTTPVCDAPFQTKLNVSCPCDLDGGDRERNHGPSPVFGISRYQVLYNSLTCRLASAKSRLKIGFTTAPTAVPATFPAPATAMFPVLINKPRPHRFLQRVREY